jgi:hypothetical protein
MAKAKKPAAKTSAAVATKAAVKKPAAAKTVAKKPAAVATKAAVKKAAVKKSAAAKTVAATKAAVKKSTVVKPAAATNAAVKKSAAAKKPAAAKPATKKPAAKKPAAPSTATRVGAAIAMAARTVAEVAKGVARAVVGGGPAVGAGTPDKPWQLTTPPGTSSFEAFRDETLDPPALVVRVGKTELRYHLRAIDDLRAWLVAQGDWVPLGGADEQKPAPAGSVEAWARSETNPVQGWYGLKSGLRGRFGVYVPPVLEALGLAEVEHGPRNNRMRAT